jgi:hypothetical protein
VEDWSYTGKGYARQKDPEDGQNHIEQLLLRLIA